MTLDNVSAIAAQGNGSGLDIFVASSAEHSLTRLRYYIGATGQTLVAATRGQSLIGTTESDLVIGGLGDDRLTGNRGDDILRDGGGIDLAAWPMLRSREQLFLAMTATGFAITYGDEVLVVHAADKRTIDHRTLTTDDLMGDARISQVILPGFAGPVWAPPALPRSPAPPPGPRRGAARYPSSAPPATPPGPGGDADPGRHRFPKASAAADERRDAPRGHGHRPHDRHRPP